MDRDAIATAVPVRDDEAPAITVWGVGTPRTLRVYWALEELGCAYRVRALAPRSADTRGAAYASLNPSGKIPTLVDGGFVLSESGAIVNYLLSRDGGDPGLRPPADPRTRARYDEWSNIASMELDAASTYVMRRHLDLPQVYGAAPEAVAAAGAYCEAALRAAAQRLGSGDWVLDERFSGADILLATSLVTVARRGLARPPPLDAYLLRATARPAFGRSREVNGFPARSG